MTITWREGDPEPVDVDDVTDTRGCRWHRYGNSQWGMVPQDQYLYGVVEPKWWPDLLKTGPVHSIDTTEGGGA